MTHPDPSSILPAPRPARWLRPLKLILLTAAAVALLLPFDGTISHAARSVPLSDSLHRSLATLQQWGEFSALILVTALIGLLDENRRHRLWDLWAGMGLAFLACVLIMCLLGRPQPRAAHDPWAFVLPWQTYRFSDGTVTHAWNLFHHGTWRLWSMPSRRSMAAMVMSIFLAALYARLKYLAVAMVIVVGVTRVLLGAHYPTDVLIGALVGYLASWSIVRGQLVSRLVPGKAPPPDAPPQR